METSQATSRQEAIAAPQRRHTVVMGRQDFFSTTMRLIGVELYKLRRRLMSKVMIVIAVIAVFLLFQIIALQGPPSLPQSFTTPIFFVTNFAGIILITILAGTIVGGEYSVGTVRLVLTRGPSRIQFLLAKLGTLLVIIAVGILLLALLGIILDVLFILITGIGFDLRFLSGEWLIHALCFTLEAVLGLFVYASLAVCLATLG
ncbi:MAG: ABC transporter permease, partial [Ktedonobacteraceae bacterium]|nr:ABC transporter permease [Ktedonobacteraceae bacterium]